MVREESRPINGLPRLLSGTQPIDGGHLIFDAEERAAFLAIEPAAATFMRPLLAPKSSCKARIAGF